MTTRAAPQNQSNKLLGLEVLRFISALAVLVYHYQHFFYVADKPVDFVREQQPLYPALGFLYQYGLCGVQVFWCISGFIFFWKYRNAIARGVVNHKSFFILRFSRLYPLHFATLLFVALAQPIYFAHQGYYFVYQNNDLTHFILQLFLASNWLVASGHSFNAPIWSISLEVLVYLFFFLALRYISKSAWVNMVVISLCVAAKVARVPTPSVDCLAFFYAGGLAAIALEHCDASSYKNLLAGLALGAAVVVPIAVGATRIYQHEYFTFVFLMTYVPVLLYVAAQNLSVPPTLQKAIAAAGNMTYSSYLLHFPIQLTIALYCALTRHAIPYYSLTFFAAVMLATLVASHYVYRFFEMPAQNYIRGVFKEKPGLRATASSRALPG
jgi:peptidoglycan/LPS O-acetylase OafA/YrhL